MRREQVFWGWGEPGAGPRLAEQADALLREDLGVSGAVSTPVTLDAVRLRAPALDAAVRERLAAIVGDEGVRDDAQARVLRCRGKSYLDLLAQRAGDCEDAPDAVVAPAGHDQVHAVLEVCAEAGVAVVPFGGGTSVVGGLEPYRAGFGALVSLDLARMDRLLDVDERSLIAVLEPGIRLPEADRALAARGLTLAHFPQSYEWATVGGCVATRSAGQSSTGHGRIDDNVVAVRMATPLGELATLGAPASAAGPSLRELAVGSEGVLGVITRAALRVRPLAGARRYEGWLARSFAAGCDALRRLEQDGAAPDVARLSDETETRMGFALAAPGGLARRAGTAVAGALGFEGGCLLVLGWEDREDSRPPSARARRRPPAPCGAAARGPGRGGGVGGGALRRPAPARRPARPRRARRDAGDGHALVEPRAPARGGPGALTGALERALVGCHVSHLYPTGASLYFTVLARQDPADPVAQWRAARPPPATRSSRRAARSPTTMRSAATTRRGWARRPGRSVSACCAPPRSAATRAGIMHPGKLLPS